MQYVAYEQEKKIRIREKKEGEGLGLVFFSPLFLLNFNFKTLYSKRNFSFLNLFSFAYLLFFYVFEDPL